MTRFRVRHRLVLLPKVLKITFSLKLKSTHCICLPRFTLKDTLGTTLKPSYQRSCENILIPIQESDNNVGSAHPGQSPPCHLMIEETPGGSGRNLNWQMSRSPQRLTRQED